MLVEEARINPKTASHSPVVQRNERKLVEGVIVSERKKEETTW